MRKIRKTEMLSKLSKGGYLDTKWENREINLVEQHADIPHFSKLEDIGTLLRLFESFFVDLLVKLIVG